VKKVSLPGRATPLKPIAPAKAGVTIRLAINTDLPVVQACARAAYAPYLNRMDREPAPMVADFAGLIQRQHVHVAVVDNAVVGYVVFYRDNNAMKLDNVAIHPDFAGCGIGKQLINFVESAAAKRGLAAVELYTNVAMTENQVLYPKNDCIRTAKNPAVPLAVIMRYIVCYEKNIFSFSNCWGHRALFIFLSIYQNQWDRHSRFFNGAFCKRSCRRV